MRTGISCSFDDVPEAVRVAAEGAQHLYDTPAWFAVELAAGTDPWLAWVAGDDGAIGYATLCASRATDPAWPYARPDLLLRELGVSEVPADALMPALLVGGRRPGHSSVVIEAGRGDETELAAVLLRTATRHALDLGAASLVVPFVDSATCARLARAAAAPSMRVRAGRSWTLPLVGAGFEDWLGALDRKVRFNERATMRKLEGVEVEARPLRAEDLDWMVPHELALYERHGSEYGAEAARRLHEAYLAVLGDRAWIVAALVDGVPAGFASLIRHGERAWVRQVGIAPGCEASQLYFGLAYHGAIRWAYEHDVRSLDYSITADEVKRRRGAQPRDLVSLVTPLGRTRLSVRPGYQPVFG